MDSWIEHCQGRPKLLVVDDHPLNIRVLNELFRFDCDVFMASEGIQALDMIYKVQPDLILLDIVMNGMDGYEVCRQLKANPLTANIPIIFITGRNEESDEAFGFELGAVDYISKPFNPIIIRARVKTHLTLKLQNDYLRGLASLDGLTGIANRRAFDEHLASAWAQDCRQGNRLSLIMIDIDYFKRYNDHLGHLAGDQCLQRVAAALAGSISRPFDLLARYGGEEFACILPNTPAAGAEVVAQVMQGSVRDMQIVHPDSPANPHVSISLGIASMQPTIDLQPADIIARADEQLYQAKQSGRARARLWNANG